MECHGITYERIKHKSYKYRLLKSYRIFINLVGNVNTKYFSLKNGWLTVKKGYAWDGCSGPSIDTKTNMRGGLVHDTLYQMLRDGYLPQGHGHRKFADKLFKKILLQDGMFILRAEYYYFGVRKFGAKYARPTK